MIPKYNRADYITALQWNYGFTKAEAEEIYKAHKRNGNLNTLNLCVEGFKRNAKEAFYND